METIGQNDDSLFSALIGPLNPYIQRYCAALTQSKQDGEDLAQLVLLKLYHAWKQQPQRHIAKAYVYRIAANMAIDWKRRRAVKEVLLPDPQLAQVGQEPLSEEMLRRAMTQLIAQLPVKQRLLIMLIDGLGCSVQQAASWFGDTRGALTVALHRARRRLHENKQQTVAPDVDEELVSRYIHAFQTASPDQIVRLIAKQSSPIPRAASDTIWMCHAA